MFSSVNAALFVALVVTSNVVNAQRLRNTTTSFGYDQANAGGNGVCTPRQKHTKNNDMPENDAVTLANQIFYGRQPEPPNSGTGWNGWAQVLSGHYWSEANRRWEADKIPVRIIYFYDFTKSWSGGLHAYINDFFNRLDGTSWWNVARKYYNLGYQGGSGPSSRQYVQGVRFDRADSFDCNWLGRSDKCSRITGLQIQDLLNTVIGSSSSFPNHGTPTAGFDKVAYFVVLGSTITETFDNGASTLGGNYCAYHSTYQTPSNLVRGASRWIKYGVVRIPDGSKGCQFNPQAAGSNIWGWEQNVIYHMAHELVEIVTDPNPAGNGAASAWRDNNSEEAMDKCETVTPSLINQNSDVPGGQAGLANINVNGRIMILPAIWDPVHQKCVMGDLGGNAWANIGCFADSGNRALSGKAIWSYTGGMTNEICQAECGAAGFGYAGTEAGGECHCSNSYPNRGTSGNCNTPCAGDPTTNCGGGWALNVWQLGGSQGGVQRLIKSHVRDNFCIEVGGWNSANGAGVNMWDCHGGANQRWTYNSHDQTLRVQHSGKCLDVPGGNGFAGQRIQQWDCIANNNNQKWNYNSKDRTFRWAGNTGLCLDVYWASDANGSLLQLWNCGAMGSNAAQAWHIVS